MLFSDHSILPAYWSYSPVAVIVAVTDGLFGKRSNMSLLDPLPVNVKL